MQIVTFWDNLHEMTKPFFLGKIKRVNSLSPAEFAHKMVQK